MRNSRLLLLVLLLVGAVANAFFMLRAGAIGHRQWVANWPVADPYNDWEPVDSSAAAIAAQAPDVPPPTTTISADARIGTLRWRFGAVRS